ncbi:MAG TPA: ATPase, T2SS/T4P/T4SS family [Phycisphaerae bacterium]|nr:ATPase, T2SS/T4P/T4SS family [Phycisphaerae bacterium]
MFDYFNVVYWLIAFASLIAWARFCTFVAEDVKVHLVDLPELPWQLSYLGILLVMFIVFITMPSFWIALPLNLVIAGTGVGIFWWKRVQILGPAGHLFKGALASVSSASSRMEERRSARQSQLTYLRHNDSPMILPKPDDPLAAGIATADQLVIQALIRRAEQVDLTPTESSYGLSFLTDGFPYHQPPLARTEAESAIQAFKVMGGLNVEERRRPQVGRFKSRDSEGSVITWTVRTSGSTAGEKLSLHANEKGQWDLRVEGLGLTTDQLNELKKLTADTAGTVIVSSPKLSGRTATLYALVRQHDAFTNSVQTLETNPQAEIEGVTVNTFDTRNTELTFSKQLSSIFLKDPNVMLVSQVPDQPTADVITRFSADPGTNGHRVYVGMTSQDAFTTLDRWLALNTDKTEAINTLRAIIAQRLVRILCPTCKIPYQPDEATLKRLNLPIGRNFQSFKANTGPILDAKGHKIVCPDCGGSGFKGRTGIFEVMIVNDEIRKAIAAKANHSQLKALLRKQNFILLVEHGIRKFASGVTAINEVTRVLAPPSAGGGSKAGVPAPK